MYVFLLFCIIYYAYAKYKHSKNVAKATTHVLAQMGLCVFSLALVFCDAYVCHIFDAVLMLASALQLLALLHCCTAALLHHVAFYSGTDGGWGIHVESISTVFGT